MGIKRKLSSNTGASIVFALAIFLISTVISVALVTISLTSTKSSASQLEDEQAYLAVSSAARLFVSAIDNTELKVRLGSADSIAPNTPGDNIFVSSYPAAEGDFNKLESQLKIVMISNTKGTFKIESPELLKYDVNVTIRRANQNDNLGYDGESIPVDTFVVEFESLKKDTATSATGEYWTSMVLYPHIVYSEHRVSDGSGGYTVDYKDAIISWDEFKEVTGNAVRGGSDSE